MNQQPTNISFEKTKKAGNDKQSGTYLIAKDKCVDDGKKEFARIEDFNEFYNYINMLIPSERCVYECIETGKRVKFHFDYFLQILLSTLFGTYDITIDDIENFKICWFI